MASFAERMNLRTVRSVVQIADLDDETRVGLWNVINSLRRLLADAQELRYPARMHDNVTGAIWALEFKKPVDEQPSASEVWRQVKECILTASWYDALDLIEAVVKYTDRYSGSADAEALLEVFNNRFEHYLVGFRFIGLEIAPVDSTEAAQAVSQAVLDAATLQGAQHHLSRAIELLADRGSPDYPNSIKESISAVEAVCVAVTGANTLGGALKRLEGAGANIHPALNAAWLKTYGWTSDEGGIRHGGIESPTADQALAKYMLVTCSAFVSYLIELSRKAKLI